MAGTKKRSKATDGQVIYIQEKDVEAALAGTKVMDNEECWIWQLDTLDKVPVLIRDGRIIEVYSLIWASWKYDVVERIQVITSGFKCSQLCVNPYHLIETISKHRPEQRPEIHPPHDHRLCERFIRESRLRTKQSKHELFQERLDSVSVDVKLALAGVESMAPSMSMLSDHLVRSLEGLEQKSLEAAREREQMAKQAIQRQEATNNALRSLVDQVAKLSNHLQEMKHVDPPAPTEPNQELEHLEQMMLSLQSTQDEILRLSQKQHDDHTAQATKHQVNGHENEQLTTAYCSILRLEDQLSRSEKGAIEDVLSYATSRFQSAPQKAAEVMIGWMTEYAKRVLRGEEASKSPIEFKNWATRAQKVSNRAI